MSQNGSQNDIDENLEESKLNNQNKKLDKSEQEMIELSDKGINTDELSPEELQKIVDNNPDLIGENNLNIDAEVKEEEKEEIDEEELKKKLIEELNEKDKIFDLLVKSNNELKNKIEMSNEKYKKILEKIEEKKNEDIESRLTNQIREMEKEISANNTETERYKKMIDKLKNKIEFKSNLERAFNLQTILKQETTKNNELKKQYNSLLKLNGVQTKFINNYDKENQITEKIDILKSEIKQTKDSIKEYQDKFNKQDRFIRLIHEKILSLEMMIKKMKEPKIKEIKSFTKEELKDTLDLIKTLKDQITENRNQLNSITKINDEKLHQLLAQNKKIEIDFKDAEKENKRLVFRKNELKRQIKNTNMGYNTKNFQVKKSKYILKNKEEEKYHQDENIEEENNNNNIEIVNENNENENNNNNNNEEVNENNQKLFSNNQNKNDEGEEENNENNSQENNENIDSNSPVNNENQGEENENNENEKDDNQKEDNEKNDNENNDNDNEHEKKDNENDAEGNAVQNNDDLL